MPAFGPISGELRSLSRRDALFRQGDMVSAFYRLEAGRLRLERRTFDGRLVLIHTARPREFLAEASLFSDSYHCDAVATEPSTVRAYPRAAILEVLQAEPATAMSFLAAMARQLHRTRQRLELSHVRSAKERVMLYLQLQAGADGRIAVAGELQEIAAELGLTREALYRSLAELERAHRIRRFGGGIEIRKSLDV